MLKANNNNPLALYKRDGVTYKLAAYFYYNDYSEFSAVSRKHLSINISNSYFTWSEREYYMLNSQDRMRFQLRHFFPQTSNRYQSEYGGYGYCFLFERYDDPIPMKMQKHIPREPQQAVLDYFINNKKLPLLVTDNCFFNYAENVFLHRDNHRSKERTKGRALYWSDVKRILCDSRAYNKPFEGQPKGDAELKPKYDVHLQENLQVTALLKGGYTTINFDEKEYDLPILPLMALSQDIKNDEFTHGLYTWFFESKKESITERILDDIFIIGNIKLSLRESEPFIDHLKTIGKALK